MAALTGARNTIRRGDYFFADECGLKTNLVFYNGQMVAKDATGFLVPALISTTIKGAARLNLAPLQKIDMTGVTSGAKVGKIEYGIFRWDNGTAGDLIVRADVGNVCYILDDHTVAKTSNTSTRTVAGTIMDVDASGAVWVLQPIS